MGEAVAVKDKIGECGRNIDDIKEIIEEDDNQVVFFPDKCNKCEIQAACNGYLGEHVRANM